MSDAASLLIGAGEGLRNGLARCEGIIAGASYALFAARRAFVPDDPKQLIDWVDVRRQRGPA